MGLHTRTAIMMIIDVILVNLSLYVSFLIRWEGQIPENILMGYYLAVPVVTIGRVLLFYCFNLYKWSFRFASFNEVVRVGKSVSIGSVLFIFLMFYFNVRRLIGRFVPLTEFLLTLFLILAFRFFFRYFLSIKPLKNSSKCVRVLVVGAGRSGETVVRELLSNQKTHHVPIGFIDDDLKKHKQLIHGLKILGTSRDISSIVKDYKINEIVIALPSASGQVVRDIVTQCEKSHVRFKIIPGLEKILSGKIEFKSFRNVRPEDLMGRKIVRIDDQEVRSTIEGKRVLVTGAGGSIGSELVRQVCNYQPKKILLFDICENDVFFLEREIKKTFNNLNYEIVIGDIKDVSLLKYTFSHFKPEVVFHAAAHKHVPLMESNPASAVKNNVIGTRNLIYASEHYKVERFVLISTDKAVNPTSIMGATKRITEMLCQAKAKIAKTKFMAVRFGNVIGSNGSVVQVFKRQIEEGGPLLVTHPEIKRYFMTVSEAVQLVLQAGSMGEGGEIFILDMGEQIKIVDLAKNLITLSGLELDQDISIEFTGLRPGEKLYEEVLLDSESDMATKNDKIYISKPEDIDINQLNRDIEQLKHNSKIMKKALIINKIKEIVPQFVYTTNQ